MRAALALVSGGEAGPFVPPTIAGAAAFYTTNGSYGGGALFHP